MIPTLSYRRDHWQGRFIALACDCEVLIEPCPRALAQQLLDHVEKRYLANKSYVAARAAVAQWLEVPLSPQERSAAEALAGRIAAAVAADRQRAAGTEPPEKRPLDLDRLACPQR